MSAGCGLLDALRFCCFVHLHIPLYTRKHNWIKRTTETNEPTKQTRYNRRSSPEYIKLKWWIPNGAHTHKHSLASTHFNIIKIKLRWNSPQERKKQRKKINKTTTKKKTKIKYIRNPPVQHQETKTFSQEFRYWKSTQQNNEHEDEEKKVKSNTTFFPALKG